MCLELILFVGWSDCLFVLFVCFFVVVGFFLFSLLVDWLVGWLID